MHFTNVERTTIDKLRHLVDIGARTHTPRTGPDEFRVFKVRARMVEATIEGDGDIHLVLQNKAFRKVIVEFADTSCAFNGATAPPQVRADAGRSEEVGGPLRTAAARVVHAAQGFGDDHRRRVLRRAARKPQHGVAPNNIELHPVLNFTYPTCPAT